MLDERFVPFLGELNRAVLVDKSLTGCLQRSTEAYFGFARTHPRLYRPHLAAWLGLPGNEASRIFGGYVGRQQRALQGLLTGPA